MYIICVSLAWLKKCCYYARMSRKRIYHTWLEAMYATLNTESFRNEISFEIDEAKSLAYFHANSSNTHWKLFGFTGISCFCLRACFLLWNVQIRGNFTSYGLISHWGHTFVAMLVFEKGKHHHDRKNPVSIWTEKREPACSFAISSHATCSLCENTHTVPTFFHFLFQRQYFSLLLLM